MDRLRFHQVSRTFIFFFLLSINARAERSGSVLFLDSPSHRYLRSSRSTDAVAEIGPMLLPEVGATISVLLGFAPPVTLSAATSSKLNEVLVPNPFKRPHTVFILEVRAAEGMSIDPDSPLFSSTSGARIVQGSDRADILLPDREEVSVIGLNEFFYNNEADCTDKEVTDIASWLGGSYVTDSLKPLTGILRIPLAGGVDLKLDLSKTPDRLFTASLVDLIRNFRRVIELHQDIPGRIQGSAELMTGLFYGIKVLQEEYGPDGVAQQGIELLFTAMSKIFDLMQAAYEGELVGVIFFNEKPPADSETMLNVIFTSRKSSRSLVETSPPSNTTAAQQLLVRRTLAWLTGIILLIATLLGIYFLLNMPLMKDSLLYSNVKLD